MDIKKDNLIDKITKLYDKGIDDMAPLKAKHQELEKYIYPTLFPDDACLLEIYQQKETFESHINRNVYKSMDSLFDVQGEDEQSEQNAEKQKKYWLNRLHKMKAQNEFGKCNRYNSLRGEYIAKVEYATDKKKIKRKTEVINDLGQKEYVNEVKEIVKYDGAKFKAINPDDFIFDVDHQYNWDACSKVYRYWLSYSEIINDDIFTLDGKAKKDLKDLSDTEDKTKLTEGQDKGFKNGLIEILEFQGDLRHDGELLENQIIVIAGRVAIIRQEENPYMQSPFVYYAPLVDRDSKRGVSYLLVLYNLQKRGNRIFTAQNKAIDLIVEPCIFSQTGTFGRDVNLEPNKNIEYNKDEHMGDDKKPYEVYDASGAITGFQWLESFKQMGEGATGITSSMSGMYNQVAKTATESTNLQAGMDVRLGDFIQDLNVNFNIPTLELMAEIEASTKYDNETIAFTKPDGTKAFETITPEIRQGNYSYSFSDNQSRIDRILKFKEFSGAMRDVMDANPQLVNWNEIIKLIFETFGYDNPEKYFTADELTKAISETVAQMTQGQGSPELEQTIKQKLIQLIPMAIQGGLNGQGTMGVQNGMPPQNAGI